MSGRVAVIVFNLGGPDQPAAVQPFLFNLFNDAAIIGLPQPMRWVLAQLISRRRAPVAREIYAHLGGRSPLLALTEAQARALQGALGERRMDARVFVCMRYWHPMSAAVAREVAAYGPDEIVLVPLYPQYSTTTTGSSLQDWRRAAAAAGITAPTRTVCCYPTEPGLVAAYAELIRAALDKAREHGAPRVLFSAHGLPERVIERGDPYQWQVERTAAAVVQAMGIADLDHVVCYQSRVGPLKWIGPATENEIDRAGRDGVPVVVVPIAFVSEHSETLVELDIEYAERARQAGVPGYVRVPAVGTAAAFVAGLADLVTDALGRPPETAPQGGHRLCPADRQQCPCRG
jgi:protoporphyrin/coproporphyrin ferrochelatase